eukprot:CAMPEP_0185262824 /NCGR_PEP_ID=MMETSP1359-20130426/10864_1 /TAXON_ID=552665 /ORGANISM="Bigelowiella longifila, Strain CCMP242" /LENGTH=418 /DNA_ID=CAMNT_0027849877 /DNA_START=184 /DNA_END=1440 /DNA_ORIENTATION=+
MIVQVHHSIVKLQGFVVAGRVFWNANKQWEMAKCLLCFKSDTIAEMMFCESDKHIREKVKEVFIALCNVVRRIQRFPSRTNGGDSTTAPPFIPSTPPTLQSFLDHRAEQSVTFRKCSASPISIPKLISSLEAIVNMDPRSIRKLVKDNPGLSTSVKLALDNISISQNLKFENVPSNEIPVETKRTVPDVAKKDMALVQNTPNASLPRWRPARIPHNESSRIRTLRSLRILDTEMEDVFDNILWLATSMCDAELGAISFVDKERQWFKARKGLGASETSRNAAFCSHTILQPDKITIIEDTLKDDRFAQNPLVSGGPKIRFYAGVPLRINMNCESFSVGSLCVISSTPKNLDDSQKIALQYLTHLTQGALMFRRDELENHGFVQDEEQKTAGKRRSLEMKEKHHRKRQKAKPQSHSSSC